MIEAFGDLSALQKYSEEWTEPLKDFTLIFLVDRAANRVLLGSKLSGVGEGYYVGIGGKVEPGEKISTAAVRELVEETGVIVEEQDLVEMIELRFYFPYASNPAKANARVVGYFAEQWRGEPNKTDEIIPEWFGQEDLPLDRMWDDARYWLPRVLEGQRLRANFLYGVDNKTVEVCEMVPLK